MNEKKSWDASLVRKFSSSNHYKLLNQLRSEVKKYPLIKKKNLISTLSKDKSIDNKTDVNTKNSEDHSHSKSYNNFNLISDLFLNTITSI